MRGAGQAFKAERGPRCHWGSGKGGRSGSCQTGPKSGCRSWLSPEWLEPRCWMRARKPARELRCPAGWRPHPSRAADCGAGGLSGSVGFFQSEATALTDSSRAQRPATMCQFGQGAFFFLQRRGKFCRSETSGKLKAGRRGPSGPARRRSAELYKESV